MRSSRRYEDIFRNMIGIGVVLICLLTVYSDFMIRKENFSGQDESTGPVYFILTSSIKDMNDDERKEKYLKGISSVLQYTKDMPNCKVILVENNGKRPTYLDGLGIDVFYTNNNTLGLEKGSTEMKDILDCIEKYKIRDNDFIVKMTARYKLDTSSPFMDEVSKLKSNTDCIIRYGSYDKLDGDKNDCITGLIGMRCEHIKRIKMNVPFIEHEWAAVANSIDSEKVIAMKQLGVYICPGYNSYFLV